MRRRARKGGGRQLELSVARLGGRGDGIAAPGPDVPARPVFVPYALPGERVRVRLTGEHSGGLKAEILELIESGPDRVEPPCPHFGLCGGCSLQHLAADRYDAWKRDLVGGALARRGFDLERDAIGVAALRRAAPNGRRRAALELARRRGNVVLGFHERESHALVDLSTCFLLRPSLLALFEPLRALGDALLAPGDVARLDLCETDGGIDLLWRGAAPPDLAGREALSAFAETQDLARLSWAPIGRGESDPEPIVIRRAPQVVFSGVTVTPPPGGFLQPSRDGEAALVDEVTRLLADVEGPLADLYAGCGTFSFALAARGGRRLHAVEGDSAALESLAAAARGAGLADRLTTERRDLAQRPLLPEELAGYEALVFDPPRMGARAQAAAIAESALRRVVAVSCNPNSFARDARILADGGFRLTEVAPIDQFPWSGHLELVAAFAR